MGMPNSKTKLKITKTKDMSSIKLSGKGTKGRKLSGRGFQLGRFSKAPTCEKIIKAVKKQNRGKPKAKRANPFAVAQANKKCRRELKLDDLERVTKM